ncbi:MAG: flagellar basal body protein, partial [Defluviitaleaceae bacterium]|nr:flagellar basal body protein [Defluviitaleaceae bacterium]
MLTSLNTAVSGMNAARHSLAVIGHNMANVNTPGFTRQRIIQLESPSQTVGLNNGSPMQVGLGTDYRGVQQIRNKFLDISYREEVGKAAFYSVRATAGRELETILGELQSDFQTQNILTDMWRAI